MPGGWEAGIALLPDAGGGGARVGRSVGRSLSLSLVHWCITAL